MSTKTTWTELDFHEMSWHDNAVHGIQIQQGQHGMGTLIFNLDYIIEWLQPVDTKCQFLIAPALLTFNEVIDLKIIIDYEESGAALTPFSIDRIRREKQADISGGEYYKWIIDINWPAGRIEFKGKGYQQILTGNIIETDQQLLTLNERKQATAVSNE